MLAQEDIAVLLIGAFMFIPLWIGGMAAKHSVQTIYDFFLQERKMGGIALFCTIAATWWSSFAFLGSNAYFYTQGPVYWSAIAWNIFFGVLYYIFGRRIWYYGKENHYMTPADFFTDMYGSQSIGNFVTAIMLYFTLPYLQIQLAGGAYLITTASKGAVPLKIAGFIFYLVIVIYIWVGGLRAVAWTDIFYGSVTFFGMIFAGFYIVQKVGGVSTLFEMLKETNPENLTLPGPKGESGYMLWISMFLITPIGALMAPPMWLRMYAVGDVKLFDKMPFLLALIAIFYIGPMLVGNTAVILEPGIQTPDIILPILLLKYAPFTLAALLLACGAAAAMSTANSQIHSLSAVYTLDIHQKYIQKNINEKNLLWVGRLSILFFATIAYLMFIYIPGLLVQIGLVALSGTAQIIVPTAGALFWKKSNVYGAMAGLICGIAVLFIFTLQSVVSLPWDMHPGVAALIANTIVFVFVSSITPSRKKELLERQENQRQLFSQLYEVVRD